MKKVIIRAQTLASILLSAAAYAAETPDVKIASETKVIVNNTTDWQIRPSFKYDLLCFINTLTADPYYLEYYRDEYAVFEPKFTQPVKEALVDLKRIIKDDGGGIISASLCLYFSAVGDETIDEMLATLDNPSVLMKNLKQTPYYSDEYWKVFDSVRDDLKTILLFLKDVDFYGYWTSEILPKVNKGIVEIEKELPRYNVVGEVNKIMATQLGSNEITVFMLYYSQPHGIRITGSRFLTDVAWPFNIVVCNAGHEMMHPPYDLEASPDLAKALETFKEDSFLMDKVMNHNPSFGYNSFEGFIEEDCVQALDQLVNEELMIAKDAHVRWREADEGMHVFAVCLYSVMKDEGCNNMGERFGDFLLRMIKEGKLSPGKLKAIYDEFYS